MGALIGLYAWFAVLVAILWAGYAVVRLLVEGVIAWAQRGGVRGRRR